MNKQPCGCYWVDIPFGEKLDEQGSWQWCPLHAAAPEMLETLKSIAVQAQANCINVAALELQCKSIITKATGGK